MSMDRLGIVVNGHCQFPGPLCVNCRTAVQAMLNQERQADFASAANFATFSLRRLRDAAVRESRGMESVEYDFTWHENLKDAMETYHKDVVDGNPVVVYRLERLT